MANDGSLIGSIQIGITADQADLVTQLDQAQSAAADAGAKIAAALTEAAQPADALDTAATGVTGSLVEMGTSAEEAGGQVAALAGSADASGSALDAVGNAAGDAAGGLTEVGSSASDAEGGLQGMAEQLLAIGEGLAITEGLKEFGQEALTAAGTVQSVTIGLTELTGSAEAADSIIGEVKTLAATEPFAFPEIAPTVQRMVALGVSAAQIPGVMQAAADAAAATGNSFDQVANSIDRISLSGTAGARQLVQLGTSTTALAEIMGVSQASFAAAFKALDQTDRLNVLTEAMAKFGGAAIAQAQGIAGQWQIFKNQFEEVMVGVGDVMTPVISRVLQLAGGMLQAAQDIIAAFEQLPAPVQDFIEVVGLAAAAVVPLVTAIAGIGFAWIGIQAAGEAVAALFATITTEAGVAAVAEGEFAIASEAAGAAAATAGGSAGIGLLASSLTAVAGAAVMLGLAEWIESADKTAEAAANASDKITGTKDAITELDNVMPPATAGLDGLADVMTLVFGLDQGPLRTEAENWQDIANTANAAADAINSSAASLAKTTTAVNEFQAAVDAAISSVAQLQSNQTLMNAEWQKAIIVYDQVQAAYNEGTASAELLAAAENQLDKAFKAANPDVTAHGSAVAGVATAHQGAAKAIVDTTGSVSGFTGPLTAASIAADAHAQKVSGVAGAHQAAKGAVDDDAIAMGGFTIAAATAGAGLIKPTDSTNTLADAYFQCADAADGATITIINGSKQIQVSVPDAATAAAAAINDLGASYIQCADDADQATVAIIKGSAEMGTASQGAADLTGQLQSIANAYQTVTSAAEQAQAAIDAATKAEDQAAAAPSGGSGKGGGKGAGGGGMSAQEWLAMASSFLGSSGMQMMQFMQNALPTGFAFDLTGGLASTIVGVPMLAGGGMVSSPTLAIIGEAGPEAVVPLTGLSSNAPAALPAALTAGSGSPSTSHITVNLNGPVVGVNDLIGQVQNGVVTALRNNAGLRI